jgi:hypothetical protein
MTCPGRPLPGATKPSNVHLALNDFCLVLKGLPLSNAQRALAILWYHDREKSDATLKSSELCRIIRESGIGNPNPKELRERMKDTGLAIVSESGFRLKHASRETIRSWLPENIDGIQPPMDHSTGYLPDAIWLKTRSYVDAVCKQLNGCFRAAYYDAASVMLRRLTETLIIEGYEALKCEQEIKATDGNYFMLKDLVERANGNGGHAGLNLGRDAKTTLKRVKEQGDRSAHNRRFIAVAADLVELQSGVRTTVQELIQLANLKRP